MVNSRNLFYQRAKTSEKNMKFIETNTVMYSNMITSSNGPINLKIIYRNTPKLFFESKRNHIFEQRMHF